MIYEGRRKLGLSKAAAGRLAGISDTYWRQIEEGQRVLTGERGLRTLARMAYAVHLGPGEMRAAGRPDLAAELEAVRALAEERDALAREDAGRMVDAVPDLTERQRMRLQRLVTDDIREVREHG
jgi:transcriptional regulator with XRE-family HTH domain